MTEHAISKFAILVIFVILIFNMASSSGKPYGEHNAGGGGSYNQGQFPGGPSGGNFGIPNGMQGQPFGRPDARNMGIPGGFHGLGQPSGPNGGNFGMPGGFQGQPGSGPGNFPGNSLHQGGYQTHGY